MLMVCERLASLAEATVSSYLTDKDKKVIKVMIFVITILLFVWCNKVYK